MSAVEYALIASLGLNVLFAVLVFRFAEAQSTRLERSHERTTEYTGELLDRLMSRDLLEYKAATNTYEESESEGPKLVELVEVSGPDRGGFGSRLGLTAYAPPDEIRPEEEMQ